jgi:hypothetical protein
MGQAILRGPLRFLFGRRVKAFRIKCKGFNTEGHREQNEDRGETLCQTEFTVAYSCLMVSKL